MEAITSPLTSQLDCIPSITLDTWKDHPASPSNTYTHTHIHKHTFNLNWCRTPCCSNLMEPSARSQTGSSCSHGLIPTVEPRHRERQTIWPPSHSHSSGSQQGRQLGVGVCAYVCVRQSEREGREGGGRKRSLGAGILQSMNKKRQVILLKAGVCSNMENVKCRHRGSICHQIVCSMNVKGFAFNKWDIFSYCILCI